MMKNTVLLLVVSLFLAGCGYKLGEIRPTPMRSVRTLAVPTFKNKTYTVRVESLLADTLTKALQQDGTYRIVPEDEADAILSCTLNLVERRSVRSVQNNVLATAEYNLSLKASFQVQDRVTGAILMQGVATGRTSFFSGNDLNTIERQAISDAAADLAVEITTSITEGW